MSLRRYLADRRRLPAVRPPRAKPLFVASIASEKRSGNIVIALVTTLARLAYATPAAVVGNTALVVFAMIGVMGIRLLVSIDLHARANQFTLATTSVVGLASILVPNLYRHFGSPVQIVRGNGMAAIATEPTFAALARLSEQVSTTAITASSPSRDA
ncbi:hypothetical protein LGN19_38040 [Burkholderia sp. AU30198]|uniref:solute carrier family 23 protein n=1 Tax=Burkholderia sp. AU30198 TaxID=2879627 RepID=UPI001CF181A8|nr:hypothetical protein [Burkholderia sp. AU30198]